MPLPKDQKARIKKEIKSWVDNKMDHLKGSVKRTCKKRKKEFLYPEFDSKEAKMAVWDAICDLKHGLEYEGSLFTYEDPLEVPEWKKVEELIQKLLTVEEIQKHNAQLK